MMAAVIFLSCKSQGIGEGELAGKKLRGENDRAGGETGGGRLGG